MIPSARAGNCVALLTRAPSHAAHAVPACADSMSAETAIANPTFPCCAVRAVPPCADSVSAKTAIANLDGYTGFGGSRPLNVKQAGSGGELALTLSAASIC